MGVGEGVADGISRSGPYVALCQAQPERPRDLTLHCFCEGVLSEVHSRIFNC